MAYPWSGSHVDDCCGRQGSTAPHWLARVGNGRLHGPTLKVLCCVLRGSNGMSSAEGIKAELDKAAHHAPPAWLEKGAL